MCQETEKEKADKLLKNTIAGNIQLQKYFDNLMALTNPPTSEEIIAFCEQMCVGEDLIHLFNISYIANRRGQNKQHGYTFRTFFIDVIKVTKMTKKKRKGKYKSKTK